MNGLAHAVVQCPPLQSGVATGQMVPQAPQFDGSSRRIVQVWFPTPPQSVKLPWQVQVPAEHTV